MFNHRIPSIIECNNFHVVCYSNECSISPPPVALHKISSMHQFRSYRLHDGVNKHSVILTERYYKRTNLKFERGTDCLTVSKSNGPGISSEKRATYSTCKDKCSNLLKKAYIYTKTVQISKWCQIPYNCSFFFFPLFFQLALFTATLCYFIATSKSHWKLLNFISGLKEY